MTEGEKGRDDLDRDLGLGARVAQQSTVRFLNRDGSFNVRREGFSFLRSQHRCDTQTMSTPLPYTSSTSISWRFTWPSASARL